MPLHSLIQMAPGTAPRCASPYVAGGLCFDLGCGPWLPKAMISAANMAATGGRLVGLKARGNMGGLEGEEGGCLRKGERKGEPASERHIPGCVSLECAGRVTSLVSHVLIECLGTIIRHAGADDTAHNTAGKMVVASALCT